MSVPQSMDRIGNILLHLKTKKMVAVHSVDTSSTPDKAALRRHLLLALVAILSDRLHYHAY